MPEPGVRPTSSTIVGYAMAAACVSAALGLSLVLGRILPFTFFLGAVTVSAWFWGTRVGCFAVLLSIVTIDVVLAPPPYEFGVSVQYIPRLIAFTLSAVLVLWVSDARHRAELALLAARDELE